MKFIFWGEVETCQIIPEQNPFDEVQAQGCDETRSTAAASLLLVKL